MSPNLPQHQQSGKTFQCIYCGNSKEDKTIPEQFGHQLVCQKPPLGLESVEAVNRFYIKPPRCPNFDFGEPSDVQIDGGLKGGIMRRLGSDPVQYQNEPDWVKGETMNGDISMLYNPTKTTYEVALKDLLISIEPGYPPTRYEDGEGPGLNSVELSPNTIIYITVGEGPTQEVKASEADQAMVGRFLEEAQARSAYFNTILDAGLERYND